MFPSILKGKEGQGSKEQGGGGVSGGGGGGRAGGGGRDERDKDSSEIVIGRVGEQLGRRNKTGANNST